MPDGETTEPTRRNPRRAYIRHAVGVPLQVRALDEGAAAGAEARDVSVGGLSFVRDEDLPVGTVVEVHVPDVEPPFTARARVAWTAPERGGGFCIGVQFLDAADAFRARMVEQVCEIERYRREVEAREGRSLTTPEAAAEWIERYAGRFPGG